MKRYILIIQMLLLMVTNLFAGYRYTTHNLNLRTGPSTKYSAITIAPRDSVTIDEDCDCKWIASVLQWSYRLYMSSKFLSKTFSKHSNYRNQYSRRQSQNRYYTNVDGYRVQSPTYSNSSNGATAICRDGTYSYSQNRRGTYSHHGGVTKMAIIIIEKKRFKNII